MRFRLIESGERLPISNYNPAIFIYCGANWSLKVVVNLLHTIMTLQAFIAPTGFPRVRLIDKLFAKRKQSAIACEGQSPLETGGALREGET